MSYEAADMKIDEAYIEELFEKGQITYMEKEYLLFFHSISKDKKLMEAWFG